MFMLHVEKPADGIAGRQPGYNLVQRFHYADMHDLPGKHGAARTSSIYKCRDEQGVTQVLRLKRNLVQEE